MPRNRSRLTALGATLALAFSALLGLGLATPASAATTHTGWVRLAHLSPDTGPVDVTLTPFGQSTVAMTAKRVTYGNVSAYTALKAGTYTVSMRPAGASVTSAPMLSTNLRLSAGTAITVVASGPKSNLTDKVVTDNLSTPPSGKSRVRLIQGATDPSTVDVRAVMGPVLARDAQYGSVTGYANVPQGRWTLNVTSDGKTVAAPRVDLTAGSVHSVLVINGTDGKARVKTITDAASVAAMPKGGVETGAGGTASNPSPGQVATVAGSVVAGLGVLLALVAALPVLRRWAR